MAGVIGSKKLGFTDYQLTSAKMRTKSEKSFSEIEAGWLVERLPAEYLVKGSRNLDQPHHKSLVDKRNICAGGANRNLYRPFGAELS